jgi:hypothetical protein
MNRITLSLAACALAVASLSSLAAVPARTAAMSRLPAERQADGIRYTTGGITENESAAFKRALHGYPLAIELLEKAKSGQRDEYTADARVHIATPAGKRVFDAQAQGPYMLVRLDPGRYDVSATLGGQTLHKKSVVVAKGKSDVAAFVFPPGTN